uniref:Clip domain-containing protein n=1 Tax=Anopheles epiroticus TaxID=199890 RepID=A0A182PAJ6_9DIPT
MRKLTKPLVNYCCLLLVLLGGTSSAPSGGDFVFPELNELAIGDPCTIAPSPDPKGFPYAREGICQRVRDCETFVPRIIREPFDIRRDVCYFEVHDPVVCCVQSPVTTELAQYDQIRVSLEDLDDTNLIH